MTTDLQLCTLSSATFNNMKTALIRPDLHKALKRLSFETERPLQEHLATAIEQYLERQSKTTVKAS
jgi:predicted transcriptional regulator